MLKTFNLLIEKIFPPCCIICQQENYSFCQQCQNKIDFIYFTPKLPSLQNFKINFLILGFYTPPLSTVIKTYKYRGVYKLAPELAQTLYKHLKFSKNIDFITAIPLHPKKKMQRGFDQTELIAQELAKLINRPYLPILKKNFHTKNLASTTDEKTRKKLTKNMFSLLPNIEIKNKNILLIDDVISSGNTLSTVLKIIYPLKPSSINFCALAHEG